MVERLKKKMDLEQINPSWCLSGWQTKEAKASQPGSQQIRESYPEYAKKHVLKPIATIGWIYRARMGSDAPTCLFDEETDLRISSWRKKLVAFVRAKGCINE